MTEKSRVFSFPFLVFSERPPPLLFLHRERTCSHTAGHPTDIQQEDTLCSLHNCMLVQSGQITKLEDEMSCSSTEFEGIF